MANYWSLVKRCIGGLYVSVDPGHLFRYLDDEWYRFNERETNDTQRFQTASGSIAGKRLSDKGLSGKNDPEQTPRQGG